MRTDVTGFMTESYFSDC